MLKIRPLQPTAAEIETCLEVQHRCWPEQPRSTLENWRFQDREWRQDKFRHRFVITLESRIVGSGVIVEPYWLEVQGKFQYNYDLLPEHDRLTIQGQSVHSRIQDYVLEQLREQDIAYLLTSIREDQESRVAWLQEHHYYSTMRYPISLLTVDSFDATPFAGQIARVEKSGITCHTLAYIQQHDPGWKTRLYETWREIDFDVPSPDPPRMIPEDEFDKVLRHPSFNPELWVIAVDRHCISRQAPVGLYAGLTAAGAADTQPDHWYVWLTGVRRTYRRRGIAMALKLTSIAIAQTRKAKRFETDNEENNPMYKINRVLGFQPKPAWHDWERSLHSSD